MIRLKTLLNEDTWIKNKTSGAVYTVKDVNKDNHEPASEDDIATAKSDKKDEPAQKTSDKKDEPAQKTDGGDSKKEPIKLSSDFDSHYYASDFEEEVEKLEGKISDADFKEIQDNVENLKYLQLDLDDLDKDDDNEEYAMQSDIIDTEVEEIKQFMKKFGESEPSKETPKSEPTMEPLDQYDNHYVKVAVERKIGTRAFNALSYGDLQKEYDKEMEARGWEQDSDGDWTKPIAESVNEFRNRMTLLANING